MAAAAASPSQRSEQGLYDPSFEHDACGVGLVADLPGRRSHDIVTKALTVLRNLDHRGAKGSDPDTGDGAGILTQIPDALLRSVCGFALPGPGEYAAGLAFLPADPVAAGQEVAAVERIAAAEGLRVLGWRDVPHEPAACGRGARAVLPSLRQLFVAGQREQHGIELDRLAFCLRKRAEQETAVYFANLSARTIVYKGMLAATQLERFYPDLSDPRYTSALALVHSRFSTNTFPSWPLAHPYRYIAHNGEINTIRGNRNWMRARESMLATPLLPAAGGQPRAPGQGQGEEQGKGLERLFPLLSDQESDSASFDACLELLHLAGRSLPEAVLMMIPQSWENDDRMDPELRAFYQFHASMMEPWDGPACVAFSDGTVIGAVSDRNGLRPGRYWVTSDGLVVLASEVGVLDIDPAAVVRKGRLQPGRIFLADTGQGRIVEDAEVKAALAARHPYAGWLHAGLLHLDDLPATPELPGPDDLTRQQRMSGYTEEELRVLLEPMARTGAEPIGSMGTDTPVAVLSARPRLVFDYFTQVFAQVTNPPLDAIREELVTSLASTAGPEQNLLEPGPASCRQIVLPYPVIGPADLARILHINDGGDLPGFAVHVVDGRYRVAGGGDELRRQLAELCAEVSGAIRGGARIIVLSDRPGVLSDRPGVLSGGPGPRGPGLRHGRLGAAHGRPPGTAPAAWAPIPSLLLAGAVHHHLIRERSRTKAGLIVDAADVRECHHVALLIGYGAAAVCPHLAISSVQELARSGRLGPISPAQAAANLIKALGKGLLKIMSKMGVSTVASYTGAQIFEAIGLGDEVISACFAGTTSRLGGAGFDVLAAEAARRHATAFPPRGPANPVRADPHGANPLWAGPHRRLETGGEYQWRRDGEPHLFSPETVFRLQHATRERRYDIFKEYTRLVDEQSAALMTLRGLLRIRGVDGAGDQPRRVQVPLDQVEAASSIVRRFATGAMSYGSISAEAHETLAIAMNRLGAR
ncbi:MAG TPA: glutamate synthase central domain-containing protein, partial [Streptosporangiaceae bacterium]|nr:glutamate synthase central domain-containing protein [Streptosporangiaceae bacterium]